MTKKWIAINILLLVTAVLFGRYLRDAIKDFKHKNNTTVAASAEKPLIPADKSLPASESNATKNPSDYGVVWEKMIFSETRSNKEVEDAQAKVAEVIVVPPLAQKPILVATTISENKQEAWIIDPTAPQPPPRPVTVTSTPGGAQPIIVGPPQVGARRAQRKRIGDTYQGYTITRINAENIVLSSGTRTETIPLHEGSKQAKGGKTAIKTTQVVSIGKPATQAGGTAPAGTQGVQTAAMMQGAPQTQAAIAARSQGTGTSPTPAPSRATSQPAPNTIGTTPSGQTIIRTPFGDVTR
jgi:hypothetical protein